jgi:DNA repair exonuclease SbcCD nuclease subunit
MIYEAGKRNCKELICLGDVFTSRKSQSLRVLATFTEILDVIHDNGLTLTAIPGNHDKTVGDQELSFLDPFKNLPAWNYISDFFCVSPNNNFALLFIPYFSEDQWVTRFDDALKNITTLENTILCSHIAVTGSVNNDGTKVANQMRPAMFSRFKKVLLGHYHNTQQIGDNIFHLPSICQNNFGEDDIKGFTALLENGEIEHIQSSFKKYVTVAIDLDKVDKKSVRKLLVDNSPLAEDSYVRFKVTGSEDKLKTFDKSEIEASGIRVVTENKDLEMVEDFDDKELVRYTDDSLIDEFAAFCEDFDFDFEEGSKYLKQ